MKELLDRPEAKAFLAAMKANPGDATTLLVAADWFEENGDADKATDLRKVAAVLPRAWKEWDAFDKRLATVCRFCGYPGSIPIKTTNRACGQKTTANMTRELFNELGLKGIGVTMATGSMCGWVNVKIPARVDQRYLMHLDPKWLDDSQAAEVNRRNLAEVVRLVRIAFPNHDDRSDIYTDYINDPFRFTCKEFWEYVPKEKPKTKMPKVVPIDGLDEKIDRFVTAWHENGRSYWQYEGTPGMAHDEYNRKRVTDRLKYVALDNGTRGTFLVEKATGLVFSIKAYGVPNRIVGTLDEMAANYEAATAETLAKRAAQAKRSA